MSTSRNLSNCWQFAGSIQQVLLSQLFQNELISLGFCLHVPMNDLLLTAGPIEVNQRGIVCVYLMLMAYLIFVAGATGIAV